MSLNKVMIIGNLGADPEVRTTGGGTSVAKITIAATEKWRNKDTGNMMESTEWITARCWKQKADFISKYAHKGSQVFVEGKLHTETWEKDGIKRSQTIIEVEDVQLLGGKPSDDTQRNERSHAKPRTSEQKPAPSEAEYFEEHSDDLPF